MLKSLCNLAAFLFCGLAAAAVPDNVGVAVKFHDYLAVRNSATAFLSRIAPDFHRDLPDNWLGDALQCGGVDCINQKGDICFICFDTPRGPAWAFIVPIKSSEFYLDSLRANLGRETMCGDAYCFTGNSRTSGREPVEIKFLVRATNGTIVLSRDEQTCSAAAGLLKDGLLPELFGNAGSPVRIYLNGRFVSKYREKVITWLIGLPLVSIVSVESPTAPDRMHLLTDAVLASAEQVDYARADVFMRPEGMQLALKITPREGTLLDRFMAAQQPASAGLLAVLPGDPMFACEGRAAALQEVEEAYMALKAQLAALDSQSAAALPPADAARAAQHALERLHRFAVNHAGHFAAALVLPPADPFGIDYLRVYEMKNAASAKDDLAWEMAAMKAEPLPAEKLAGADVLAYRIGNKKKLTELRAAFVGNLMLIASGPSSAANITRMIGLARLEPGEPAKGAVTQAPSFVAATTAEQLAPPAKPAAMAFFSLTALLNLAGNSGKAGMESLRLVQPTGGLAAWITTSSPRPAAGAAPFTVHLSIPADELIVTKETILGDIPLLGLDLPPQ